MKTKLLALFAGVVFMTTSAFASNIKTNPLALREFVQKRMVEMVANGEQIIIPDTVRLLPLDAVPNVTTRKVVNCSARLPMSGTPIIGFVTKTDSPHKYHRYLIRAIGPSLGSYGVDIPNSDPKLTIHGKDADGKDIIIAENDDWSTSTDPLSSVFAQTGAFPLPAGSKDAAVLVTLPTGAYTAVVTSPDKNGIVLVELYDLDATDHDGFVNLSIRGSVLSGQGLMIFGFVTSGPGTVVMLMRGVGPSLSAFGVPDCLPDPQLQLTYNGHLYASDDDWFTQVGTTNMAAVGAFPFPPGSLDSAMILAVASLLDNMQLTLQLSAATKQSTSSTTKVATTGSAMIEIYFNR